MAGFTSSVLACLRWAENLRDRMSGFRVIQLLAGAGPATAARVLERLAEAGSPVEALNDRERRIFEARRLADEPVTLEELAERFRVSRERIRQIEVRAFEKVQKTVLNSVAIIETPSANVERLGLVVR